MTIAPPASEKGAKGEWELFCHDGEMKLYTRRGIEINLRFLPFFCGNREKYNEFR